MTPCARVGASRQGMEEIEPPRAPRSQRKCGSIGSINESSWCSWWFDPVLCPRHGADEAVQSDGARDLDARLAEALAGVPPATACRVDAAAVDGRCRIPDAAVRVPVRIGDIAYGPADPRFQVRFASPQLI